MAQITRCLSLFTKPLKSIILATQTQKIARWVSPTRHILKLREGKAGGKKIFPRNTYLEWNLEAELYAFNKRLNEDIDTELLLQAFTDRSYVIKEEMKQKEMEFDVKMKDNKELAEQGERFIKDYIQLYLQTVLPKFPLEGVSAVGHHLTSDSTIAHVSLHLGTKDIILAAQYPVDSLILAKTFRAIVAAIMQSSGDEQAAHFVRDFLITQLQGKDVNDFWHIADPWSMLIGFLAQNGATVEPRLIGEVGGNTLLACYRVGLYIDKKMISSGFGENITTAKEMASREALKKIFGTEDHMKPINFKLEGIPKPNSQKRYQIAAS